MGVMRRDEARFLKDFFPSLRSITRLLKFRHSFSRGPARTNTPRLEEIQHPFRFLVSSADASGLVHFNICPIIVHFQLKIKEVGFF